MLLYHEGANQIEELKNEDFFQYQGTKWVHFREPQDPIFEKVLEELHLHPLGHSLMTQFSKVSKFLIFEEVKVLSLFVIRDDSSLFKISILIGKDYIMTVTDENKTDFFEQLYENFKKTPEQMASPGLILYHILNKTLDLYLTYVDELFNKIQTIEKQVYKTPFENEIGKQIYNYKGTLHQVREKFEPLGNTLETISKTKDLTVNSSMYFQDLPNKFDRVIAALDGFKDNLNAIFNLQMSLKSDHTNTIVRILTLFSVIFTPMSFIAAIYGMSFKHIPELYWKYGYPYALILMFGVGLCIAFYFKKKGWWGRVNKQK